MKATNSRRDFIQRLSFVFVGTNLLSFFPTAKALAKSPISNTSLGKIPVPPGSVLVAQTVGTPCSPNGAVGSWQCWGMGQHRAIICKGGTWTELFEEDFFCC